MSATAAGGEYKLIFPNHIGPFSPSTSPRREEWRWALISNFFSLAFFRPSEGGGGEERLRVHECDYPNQGPGHLLDFRANCLAAFPPVHGSGIVFVMSRTN